MTASVSEKPKNSVCGSCLIFRKGRTAKLGGRVNEKPAWDFLNPIYAITETKRRMARAKLMRFMRKAFGAWSVTDTDASAPAVLCWEESGVTLKDARCSA